MSNEPDPAVGFFVYRVVEPALGSNDSRRVSTSLTTRRVVDRSSDRTALAGKAAWQSILRNGLCEDNRINYNPENIERNASVVSIISFSVMINGGRNLNTFWLVQFSNIPRSLSAVTIGSPSRVNSIPTIKP